MLVFLVNSTQTGLVAAKVMQKNLFDQNEWNAAGILNQREPIPFVVQFNAAEIFDQQASLDNIIKRKSILSGRTIRAIAKQLLQEISKEKAFCFTIQLDPIEFLFIARLSYMAILTRSSHELSIPMDQSLFEIQRKLE
ncbi:MAG: hypothetical protein EZS28_041738, partial [Streblomastix strix]